MLLLLALAPPLAAAPSERQLKEAELGKLRARITELRQAVVQVKGRYESLRQELKQVETAMGRLIKGLDQTRGALGQTQQRLRRLGAEERELATSVEHQRAQLVKQIRSAYAMGRQEYLKILLNQEDPATLGRVLTYYDYLNQARGKRIDALMASVERLKQVQAGLEQERLTLERLKAQQLAEKQELETQGEARERLLGELKQELADKDQRLAGLLRDEKELERLILALSEALADIPAEPGNYRPFAQRRGQLKWPAEGDLAARFGKRRQVGELTWQGVLIQARAGAPVKAVSRGRVAFADWLRGYGLLVIIDHGEGYMSLYGYNQALYKETGDWVEEGEVIAGVGSSGGHERSALYFEIRRAGKPTNPARWCRS